MGSKWLRLKSCLTGYKGDHKQPQMLPYVPTRVYSRLNFIFDFFMPPAVTNNQWNMADVKIMKQSIHSHVQPISLLHLLLYHTHTHTDTHTCVSWYPHAQHYYNKHACAKTHTHTHTHVCVSWYPHAQHYYNKHACAKTHTHTHVCV